MNRLANYLLIGSLLAISSPSFAANDANISPAERTKIESVVHDYLLKNPQILVEVMQVLQQNQATQAQQTVKLTQKVAPSFTNALFHQANDPVAGNPNGSITIVEFFDFRCGHCIAMASDMDAIIKSNPDLRVVYKIFPIGGALSEFAGRAALAAMLQNKYNEFSHALLTADKPLTQDVVLEIAKSNGIDVNKLKTDMDNSAIQNQIQATLKLAKDLKLFGTPALFVGKTDATSKQPINYIPGQADKAQLQNAIDQIK